MNEATPPSKKIFRALLFMLPVFVLALSVAPAFAFQEGGNPVIRKELPLVMNKSYELFIGNGGVYMDNSRHIGTLVLKSEEWPENRSQSWQQFTQRLLDVRVYEKGGAPFDRVYGIVRVYFNLDSIQYDMWQDEERNMSIWQFDELNGGWRKCVTHWEPAPGLRFGRLWCLVKQYTRYGLAWTQPTLLMKLIKQGVITVTPSPTP
jgi:hypothetical protein